MDRSTPGDAAAVSSRVLARWVLLCAVIAGFLLHVLAAEGGHGVTVGVPTVTAMDHRPGEMSWASPGVEVQQAPAEGDTSPLAAALPGDPDDSGRTEGLLLGCVLLLVVIAPRLLQGAGDRRRPEIRVVTRGPAIRGGVAAAREPSPPATPRLALCVIRI